VSGGERVDISARLEGVGLAPVRVEVGGVIVDGGFDRQARREMHAALEPDVQAPRVQILKPEVADAPADITDSVPGERPRWAARGFIAGSDRSP
jgi:hypothetical protein